MAERVSFRVLLAEETDGAINEARKTLKAETVEATGERASEAEDARGRRSQATSVVALFDWSQLIEDYLDNIGVTLEAFCREMSGGWMFGYLDALRAARLRPLLFCVSARVEKTTRFEHAATGATICVLPAPRVYRALRRLVLNPYASTVEEASGNVRGLRRALCFVLKELAPYLSTPPLKLARELKRERAAALVCQDYEHGRFDVCRLVTSLLGLPLFASFQGGDHSRGLLERLVRRFSLNACDGLIIATRREVERVRRRYHLPASKMTRIFNPLDLSDWRAVNREQARAALGIPQEARVAVWHGRVQVRRKGLDVLLDAWERVSLEREGRDLRLLLVGTGNDRDDLRRRIDGLEARNVFWVDEYVCDHSRLRNYLSAADVYAFSSRHEGFAVAPIEAMACGLPLVASDAPGVSDILEEGEFSGGIVVPTDDAPSLASALGRLLDDPALSRTLGQRARLRTANAFSLPAVGSRMRAFFLRRGAVLV
ncbi:MAG TPA: glycosyltransferase family 4 protein [Pyrinomonadaceae bacterium]|jgi:starch synthase